MVNQHLSSLKMAYSHDGSADKARTIIRGAAEAKADAINFHITSMKDYMVPQYTGGRGRITESKDRQSIYDYLCEISLSQEAWKELFAYARERRLFISTMCNDLTSVEFAFQLGPDMYGIHSACLAEEDLIIATASIMSEPTHWMYDSIKDLKFEEGFTKSLYGISPEDNETAINYYKNWIKG